MYIWSDIHVEEQHTWLSDTGCWNLVKKTGSFEQCENEMKKNKVDIIRSFAHRWIGSGKLTTKGYRNDVLLWVVQNIVMVSGS